MKINFTKIEPSMKISLRWLLPGLIVFVIAINFYLLKVILNNGFTADDWLLLFDYKTTGPTITLLDKVFAIFHAKGIYTSYQVLFIGFLENIFRSNYQAYQITNIILKILAIISLYPLILIVFRRRLLAALTTILYAISYSSSGALQFVIKGSDYLAIFFMNLCLIAYYYSFKTKRKILLLLTTILLFLSFMLSPIRIYPFLFLIILIEVFMCIKSKRLLNFVGLFIRLIIIFLPFLIILRFGPGSTGSYLTAPQTIYKLIFNDGNYQLLLTPFSGLGYTFLPNSYWGIFGKVTFDSLKDYLLFLLHGPVIIYTILTILLGFLITKKPLFFILGIIFTNLMFEVLTYFFVTNIRGVVGPNVKGFYEITTYAIFFGFFCISVALSSLILWLKNHRSNILLLSLFIGPIFSSVFLWGTWLIIGDSLNFIEGIHWYLIIPPIGSSLFLGSLMVLGFDRVKKVTNSYLRWVLISCLFLVILLIFLISSKEINRVFTQLLHIGYGASDQEEMKAKLLSYVKNPLDEEPKLFYLDTSEDLDTPSEFYPVTVISGFGEKMHFRDWELINGCIGLIYDKSTLEKSVVLKDGIKGFNVNSLCVYNYFSVGRPEVFYKVEDFYAFKLQERQVIDIKEDTLKVLGF